MTGRTLVAIVTVALLAAACQRATNERDYEVRGMVRGFAPDRTTIDIEHEDIPGFMPSMTMPFTVRNRRELADLNIGDAISFRMVATEKDLFLERIKKISAEEVHIATRPPIPSATPGTSPRLREGDAMPVFSLIDQDGRRISLDTFRGQPFVLTFIFTRCPIPNFCPRISNNFGQIQNAVRGKARLLSLTLDPQFDTPAVLKQYAGHLDADPAAWTFATGDVREIETLTRAFSIYRQNEGGTISHGLATALIDKTGVVRRIWRGNAWSPDEVLEEVNKNEP